MKWYLVYCKANDLIRAKKNFKIQNIESYYPLVNLQKSRYGKINYKLTPLFKNYLFIRLSLYILDVSYYNSQTYSYFDVFYHNSL